MVVSIGNTLVKGNIFYRFGKKWKKKYCVLDKSTKVSDHVRLFLLQNEEEYNNVLSTTKDLSNYYQAEVYGCYSGIHFDNKSFCMILMCAENVQCMALEDFAMMDLWKSIISDNLREISVRVTLTQKIKRRKESLDLQGLLHIQQHRVCFINWLTDLNPPKLFFSILLTDIHSYGIVDDCSIGVPRNFCITASKSTVNTEDGVIYKFECDDARKLNSIIKEVINDHVFEEGSDRPINNPNLSLSSDLLENCQPSNYMTFSDRTYTGSTVSTNYSHVLPSRSTSLRDTKYGSHHQRTHSLNYNSSFNDPQRRPSYTNQFAYYDEQLDETPPSPVQYNNNPQIIHSPPILIKKHGHTMTSITNLHEELSPSISSSPGTSYMRKGSWNKSQSPDNNITRGSLESPRSKSAGLNPDRNNFFPSENSSEIKRVRSFHNDDVNELSFEKKPIPDKKENVQKLIQNHDISPRSPQNIQSTNRYSLERKLSFSHDLSPTAIPLRARLGSDQLLDSDSSTEGAGCDLRDDKERLPPAMKSLRVTSWTNPACDVDTEDYKATQHPLYSQKLIVSAITNQTFTLGSCPSAYNHLSASYNNDYSAIKVNNLSSGEDGGTLSQSDASSDDSHPTAEERSDNFNSSSTARLIPSSTSSQISSSHNSSNGTSVFSCDSPDGLTATNHPISKLSSPIVNNPTQTNCYHHFNPNPSSKLTTIQERNTQREGRERSVSMCSSNTGAKYIEQTAPGNGLYREELFDKENIVHNSDSMVNLPWNLFKSENNSPNDVSQLQQSDCYQPRSRSRTDSSDNCEENIYEEIGDPSLMKSNFNKDLNSDGISPPACESSPFSKQSLPQHSQNDFTSSSHSFVRQLSGSNNSTYQQKNRPRYSNEYIDSKTLRRNRSESHSTTGNAAHSSPPNIPNSYPEYVHLSTHPNSLIHVYENVSIPNAHHNFSSQPPSSIQTSNYVNSEVFTSVNFESEYQINHDTNDNPFPDHYYDNLCHPDQPPDYLPKPAAAVDAMSTSSSVPASSSPIDPAKVRLNYAILELCNPPNLPNLPFVPVTVSSSSLAESASSLCASSTSTSNLSQRSQFVNTCSPKLYQQRSDYAKIDFVQTRALKEVHESVKSNAFSESTYEEQLSSTPNSVKKQKKKSFLSVSGRKS